MPESLFLIILQALGPATLLKKRLWHRFFPVNFVKFLKTPFLQNTSGQLLLRFERNANIYKISIILEMSYLFPNHFSGKLLDYSFLVKNDQ